MADEGGWNLDPGLIDSAFPFHLVLDRDLRVIQTGPSIRRLHPGGVLGSRLSDLFVVTTPKVAASFEAFAAANPRSLFLLSSTTRPGLVLRGQVLHRPGADKLFFVGSPWITQTADFAALDLTLDDFAVSDAVVDYVLLLQNQGSSLGEAKEFAVRLRQAADTLTHQAFHDVLTGLPNRALLLEHLDRLRQDVRASSPHPPAVLTLDVDGFKAVNDNYGHLAGDDVLQVVARRIRDSARVGDFVARFGGDEFAVVLEAGPHGAELDEDAVRVVAERVLTALSSPIPLPSSPEISVELSASIGFAYGDWAESGDDLLRNADLAMYAAKAGGGSRCEKFAPAMHLSARTRLDLASRLRHVIDGGQLRVDYQPILRLDGDRFVGAEALLRWQHPTMGLLGPGEFVDMAEETGLIVAIGAWVLDEACRELRIWQEGHTGEHPLRVAVNISGRQFGPDLLETVATTLDRHGIEPGCLTLEVTEGLITGDGPGAHETLSGLKRLGVWLAIDDFGTGHSSLGRLREYEFDELKIDRRFVQDLDAGDTTLVSTQLALARGLGLGVVAEGVETPLQLQLLREMGCALVQGYLIARPLPPQQVRALLAGPGEWLGGPRGRVRRHAPQGSR